MKQKRSILKLLIMAVLLTVAVGAGSLLAPGGKAVAAASLAACTPAGTTYGTDTMSVAIPSTLPYHIWVRTEVASVSASSPLLLNLNNATGTNCYAVPGSAFTTAYTTTQSAWVWVDATAGLTAPGLSAGNQTLVVTGTQSGAALDSVEFLSDPTCNPNTTDCTTPTDTTPPTVSLTTPANNATVSGTTTLTANASDDSGTVSKVEFYKGSTLLATDTSSPYTYSWNTKTVPNGTYAITAKAYDPSNNIGTSSTVSVTVNNAVVTCTTGTLAPPTGLTKGTITYTSIALSWTAPAPTTGCSITGYKVFRDGTQVGTPTGAGYTDTGLTAGGSHSYTIEAVDSGPNTSSQSATINAAAKADDLAPNMPGGLSATAASASTINLSWAGSTDNPNPGGVGIAGYNIYRCSNAGCTPNITGTPLNSNTPVSGTTYNDTTGSPSTQYIYVVTAVDNVGNESAPSTSVNAVTKAAVCSGNPTTPGVPTKTSSSVTTISFNWTASTDTNPGCTLQGYHVYRTDVSTTIPIATVTGSTSYTNTGLAPNTLYTYTVKAFDTSSNSSSGATAALATLPDTTAPTAPGSVTATVGGPTQVSLTWIGSSDNVGVTGYKIYRSDKGSTAITTIPATTLSFSDTTVAANTSYTYQVSALDAAGNESTKTSSNVVQTPVPTDTTPPTAPSNLAAPVIASQSASLTWSASTDNVAVAGYHVYINNVYDTDSPTNSFALACIAPGVSYTVTVKAFDSSGNVSTTAATKTFSSLSGGLSADFNCTGSVNSTDLSILARDWGKSSLLPIDGDANGDTIDNSIDLSKLATNWGK